MPVGEDVRADAEWVAGTDGCRIGWFVVLRNVRSGAVRCRSVPAFEALFDLSEEPAQIGIDVIIGLPDAPRKGGRACDRQARQLLGWPRSSSVFSPPAQVALARTSYDEALQSNREQSPDGVGISKQAFHLFPKLRAVDARMTPARQERVREVHPELAFFAMNDDTPLRHSKHTDEGQHEREHLLREQGFPEIATVLGTQACREVTRDDILDAHAVCWTAQRLHRGTAQRLPEEEPPRNAKGLRMEIWR